jgi:hypothetical protein
MIAYISFFPRFTSLYRAHGLQAGIARTMMSAAGLAGAIVLIY